MNRYPGVPHGFEAIAPQIKQATKIVADRLAGLKWLLDQGKA